MTAALALFEDPFSWAFTAVALAACVAIALVLVLDGGAQL